jgi:hypothetical protein
MQQRVKMRCFAHRYQTDACLEQAPAAGGVCVAAAGGGVSRSGGGGDGAGELCGRRATYGLQGSRGGRILLYIATYADVC